MGETSKYCEQFQKSECCFVVILRFIKEVRVKAPIRKQRRLTFLHIFRTNVRVTDLSVKDRLKLSEQ
jgi:hypothetical protein